MGNISLASPPMVRRPHLQYIIIASHKGGYYRPLLLVWNNLWKDFDGIFRKLTLDQGKDGYICGDGHSKDQNHVIKLPAMLIKPGMLPI